MQASAAHMRAGHPQRGQGGAVTTATTKAVSRSSSSDAERRRALRRRRPPALLLLIALLLDAAILAAAPAAFAGARSKPTGYTVTPSVVGGAAGHGTISPAAAQNVGSGGTVTFTFSADSGYEVKEIRVDGGLVTPTTPTTYAFPPVWANHTISVEFQALGDTHTWVWEYPVGGSWANTYAWLDESVPVSGDSLVFSSWSSYNSENDIDGLTLADVAFTGGGYFVYGKPVTVTGAVSQSNVLGVNDWSIPTTLSGTPHFAVAGEVDELRLGALSGDADLVVDPGSGVLTLTGIANTYTGATRVAGILALRRGASLPAASAVSVAAGGTLRFFDPDVYDLGTCVNAISGPSGAAIHIPGRRIVLSGDNSGFAGTTTADSGAQLILPDAAVLGGDLFARGVVRGTGTVGDLATQGILEGWDFTIVPAHLSPALTDYEVGALEATGSATLGNYTKYEVDVVDDGTGFDNDLLTADAVAVTADHDHWYGEIRTFTVALRSSDGSASADLENFDPDEAYRWTIATASSPVTIAHPDVVSVDASDFNGGTAPGTFSLEVSVDGLSLQVVYTPVAFKAAPVMTGSPSSVADGTTQRVTWETNAPVGTGSFALIAVDAASHETTVVALVPANGTAAAGADWTVAQMPGPGWTLYVAYSGGGRSSASNTFAITKPALAVTAPAAATLYRYAETSVTWTTGPAVDAGSYRVWLKDTATGVWTRVTPAASPVPAESGKTSYSVPWTVTQPLGTYKLWVYYYAPDGTTVLAASARAGSLTIAAKPVPTVTSPTTASFMQSVSTTVTWTMNTAVAEGSFRIWLKDTASGAWVRVTPAATPVPAESGKTGYAVPWKVTQATGTYKLWVYCYGADGSVVSTGASAGTVAITPRPMATVGGPSGELTKGGETTVTWEMNAAAPVGCSFRIWLKDTTSGAWVRVTPAAAPIPDEAGKLSWAVPWKVTQPAGTYRLWVYCYEASGAVLSAGAGPGTVTIAAP